MKKIKRLSVIFLILLLSSSCFMLKKRTVEPQTLILPLGDTIRITDGCIVYGLPMTVFEIVADLEKRIEKPGPYAKYAGDMLGIKDIIAQEKEVWSIKGIRLNSVEELDPSEFYIIESNTLFQTNALALKKEGLILDLNPEIYKNPTEEMIMRVLENGQLRFPDMGAGEYFVSQNDTAFRLVNVDTAFIKIPYLVEKKKQLTIEQLAEKAAKALLELREGKHLILTGETNVFPQDRSAIDEMNRLEREYLALFAGKSRSEAIKISYTLIPRKDMSGNPLTLFRFSTKTGPSDSDKTGTPVTINFNTLPRVKDLTIITKPYPEKETVPKYDKLFYRIPEVVTVNVKMGEETLCNSRKLIYQFGEVIQLPANYIIGK